MGMRSTDSFSSFKGEILARSRAASVCSRTAQEMAMIHSHKYGENPLVASELHDALNDLEKAKHEAHLASLGDVQHGQPKLGTAGVGKAVFMLIKAFVGTGILFLPKAFGNGGIIFSSVVLTVMAALSWWCYLLLVWARNDCKGSGGSFGDIAEYLGGKWMRAVVQVSIFVSQIGFVCAYMIFIADNLRIFTLNVSDCAIDLNVGIFIVALLAIFIPLAMIRRIEKLGFVSIIAELFILYGVGYIFYYCSSMVIERGFASDLQMFNSQKFPLFIGTAVYSYEGIGLVIPITEAMREPHKFPRVLTITLVTVTALFITAGILGYVTFGPATLAPIVQNLPATSPIVYSIQILYAIAIAFSVPLQFFPAVTISEKGLFGPSRSGRNSAKWKWSKNVYRSALLGVCVLISWLGAGDLDKFISLIGSFACIPLCFIYPPLFHLKSGTRSRKEKLSDILLIILGFAVMIYATVLTVMQIVKGGQDENPQTCQPRQS